MVYMFGYIWQWMMMKMKMQHYKVRNMLHHRDNNWGLKLGTATAMKIVIGDGSFNRVTAIS